MRVKQTTISYLAGLLDGEGYVGIKKSKRPKDCISPIYHERIQIRMIEENAIKLFKKVFGGNYYRETEHSKYSKRPLYCYQASDKLASKILEQLLPFLIVKRKQAEICLQLRKSKESKLAKKRGRCGAMDKRILDYRDNLWKQIKQLHQKPRIG